MLKVTKKTSKKTDTQTNSSEKKAQEKLRQKLDNFLHRRKGQIHKNRTKWKVDSERQGQIRQTHKKTFSLPIHQNEAKSDNTACQESKRVPKKKPKQAAIPDNLNGGPLRKKFKHLDEEFMEECLSDSSECPELVPADSEVMLSSSWESDSSSSYYSYQSDQSSCSSESSSDSQTLDCGSENTCRKVKMVADIVEVIHPSDEETPAMPLPTESDVNNEDEDLDRVPEQFPDITTPSECRIISATILDVDLCEDIIENGIAEGNELNVTAFEDNHDHNGVAIENELSETICEDNHDNMREDENAPNAKQVDYNDTMTEFRSIICHSKQSDYVLMCLKETVHIYGMTTVNCLVGRIDIFGYEPLNVQNHDIYSPLGYAPVAISPLRNENVTQVAAKAALSQVVGLFGERKIKRILADYDEANDAIILLLDNSSHTHVIQAVQGEMIEHIFPRFCRVSRSQSRTQLLRPHAIFYPNHDSKLSVLPLWDELEIKSNTKMLIAGGKSVGKSTLVRYLINTNLRKHQSGILLIDLDIGQAEIFVPGSISCTKLTTPLLGPGYFYNIAPAKAYAIGSLNICLTLQRYVAAIKQLALDCHEMFPNIPWIINTMGYCRGYGVPLLSEIIYHMKPTDVIQIQSKKAINNFVMPLYPNLVAKHLQNQRNDPSFQLNDYPQYMLHRLNSTVHDDHMQRDRWSLSARTMRSVNILFRLSHIFDKWGGVIVKDNYKLFDLNKVSIKTIASPPFTVSEVASLLVEIALVFLCKASTDEAEAIECLGIGVMFETDLNMKTCKVIHRLPSRKIEAVNVIALTDNILPKSILMNILDEEKLESFIEDKSDMTKPLKTNLHRPARFHHGNHQDPLK